ncbi:MAG: hypothetical protein JWR08_1274 [Enterovirga sp.]|nr:hypothetical protein [Enterovirga sp.]
MTDDTKGSARPEGAGTRPGHDSGGGGQDSPKRQGDKLATGAAATATASELGREGDSPKRQGDKLDHAAKAAAGR